ncbi:MAG: AI-2E family transporter [Rhodospirillaceae bacterium]|nr:AI-2E family transporter [Rhodospirillaceae bacterium]
MGWTSRKPFTQSIRNPLSRIVVHGAARRFDPAWIVAGVAALAFAYFARPLLVPIVAAVLLYYTFAPAKRWLCRRGIHPLIASLGFVGGILLLLSGGVTLLAQPLSAWIDGAPLAAAELQRELSAMRGPVEKVKSATEKVEKMTKGENEPGTMEVVVRDGGLTARVFGGFSDFATTLGATLILLFYLLARPAPPERPFVAFLPGMAARRRGFLAVRRAERDLARYLGTVAIINFGLGTIGAAGFLALGMPDPIVLGVTLAVLNFVPFLGALAAIVLTFIVGLGAFDTISEALMAPALVAALHLIEANFVTPSVLGSRLTLDPFLVFVSLLLGAWMWGVAGALMAVPLLLFLAAARASYLEFKAANPAPAPAAGHAVEIKVDGQGAVKAEAVPAGED